MSDSHASADDSVLAALAQLDAAVTALLSVDLTRCSDDLALRALPALERDRRRLVAVDHRQVSEIDARGLAREHGFAKTVDLLVAALRIDRGEARARVIAAQDLGPRRDLAGQPLGPVLPYVAEASRDGAISSAHARVVAETLDALPHDVAAEKDRQIEGFLVEQARQFEPRTLKSIARRLLDTVDPDGSLSDEADRARRRHLTAIRRADGSVHGSFDLEPLTGEALLTVLDTLARPRPADGTGAKDRRTPGQRNHDGLRDLLMMALRSGSLAACGGVAATLLITMTAEQAASGAGLAKTAHGGLVPVPTALTLAGEAQMQLVRFDSVKGIEAYSHTQRLFTAQQRLALIARDGGCSAPGCTMPPALTEAHHIVEWATSRRTSVDNGTLLCGEHHRELPARGWRCVLKDGFPHWIAPAWLDPDQVPRRNVAHHPELVFSAAGAPDLPDREVNECQTGSASSASAVRASSTV